jgi:hypothetical protein
MLDNYSVEVDGSTLKIAENSAARISRLSSWRRRGLGPMSIALRSILAGPTAVKRKLFYTRATSIYYPNEPNCYCDALVSAVSPFYRFEYYY